MTVREHLATLRVAVLSCAVVAGALGLQLAGPTAADAAAGDPLRGTGVVTRVLDGDTIDVRVAGTTTDTRVRLSGIQAFETGECGADIATARLRRIVEGKRVELRAKVAGASSLGRPIRSVHLPLASGGTADVTQVLLLEGLGLWFPFEPEVTTTARYNVAATHARNQGRGIWRDDLCGAGPQAGHPIDMWVKSDADGNDSANLNDEYVVIVNRHASNALNLGGWLLRESSQFRQRAAAEGYRFPAGTSIPAGQRITVRVGSGRDTATVLHMGSVTPLFDNADRTVGTTERPVANLGMGDGAYLLDPRGNVRQAFTYPCVVSCATSLRGKLVIDHVEYDPPGVDSADDEYVRLKNVSGSRIQLDGYQLRNIYVAHEFRFGTYLDAGETLTVTVGKGTSSRTQQFWGQDEAMLRNAGDRVDVLSFDERFVDCEDWGAGRDCPWNAVQVPGAGSSPALSTAPELAGGEPEEAGRFADVRAGSTHAAAIAWLVDQGITSGCGPDRFCPNDRVPRQQMATFLTEALDLKRNDDGRFDDVRTGSTHAGAIGALADARITTGCRGSRTTFCPGDAVTREQMATFLTAAFDLQRRDDGRFDDVRSGSTHAGAIGAIAEAGITTGCSGSTRTFCPTDSVTRAQMATFLKAALD